MGSGPDPLKVESNPAWSGLARAAVAAPCNLPSEAAESWAHSQLLLPTWPGTILSSRIHLSMEGLAAAGLSCCHLQRKLRGFSSPPTLGNSSLCKLTGSHWSQELCLWSDLEL